MEEKENLFKCANDLKVTIAKDNGEVVMDEECCTNLSILVKNSGEMATSFLGAHSPEMVKILNKVLRKYFKSLKKTLKAEYRRNDNEEITVIKGDSNTNSPEIEKALEKEVDIDIKYEFESLKDIEKAVSAKTQTKKTTKKTNANKSNKISKDVHNTKIATLNNTKTNKKN